MDIEALIHKAVNFNLEEIRKYNPDMELLHEIAWNAGLRLAKEYSANENIVKISLALMDAKLPEASFKGLTKQHIAMSAEAAKEILQDTNCLTSYEKENIIKCIEEHHGAKKYFSIESEVVANADCYKFVSPKGVFYYASMLGRRFHDLKLELDQLDFKLNEKHNAISLEVVKRELEPYYKSFQNLLNEAKNN